jgi:hypothetical protein
MEAAMATTDDGLTMLVSFVGPPDWTSLTGPVKTRNLAGNLVPQAI